MSGPLLSNTIWGLGGQRVQCLVVFLVLVFVLCLGIVLMRHYSALFLHEINTLVTFIKPFMTLVRWELLAVPKLSLHTNFSASLVMCYSS